MTARSSRWTRCPAGVEESAASDAAGVTPSDHKRWLLVGCGGAGKSTLALEMAQLLGIPIIHLDRHYWKVGWVETGKQEWAEKVAALIAQDEWMMDGNYGGTLTLRLTRAHAVVLLDLPVWQCVWGIFRRALFERGQRPDIADGCDEQLPDRTFLWYVLTYMWRARSRLLAKVAAAPQVSFIRLTSRRAVDEFVEELRIGRLTANGA
ncbi:MAG: hypothetical protein O2992_00155 [Gemmatimonadetes bacterium]|jgi:adenylate kinase family enzyme|nr:hypothetical protein [Gemmatimonadota bacterium]